MWPYWYCSTYTQDLDWPIDVMRDRTMDVQMLAAIIAEGFVALRNPTIMTGTRDLIPGTLRATIRVPSTSIWTVWKSTTLIHRWYGRTTIAFRWAFAWRTTDTHWSCEQLFQNERPPSTAAIYLGASTSERSRSAGAGPARWDRSTHWTIITARWRCSAFTQMATVAMAAPLARVS